MATVLMGVLKEYSIYDVEQHCTHEDLWIIYKEKVYNMTPYYDMHPGGLAMLRYAGKDATMALQLVGAHGIAWSIIEKKLEECLIGVVVRR